MDRTPPLTSCLLSDRTLLPLDVFAPLATGARTRKGRKVPGRAFWSGPTSGSSSPTDWSSDRHSPAVGSATVGADADQRRVLWFEGEVVTVADRAGQGLEGLCGQVDDGSAHAALEVRVGHTVHIGEMIDRARPRDVGMGDDAQVAERGQSPVDGGPVHARSPVGGQVDDLGGAHVPDAAGQDLQDRDPRRGDPLMTPA